MAREEKEDDEGLTCCQACMKYLLFFFNFLFFLIGGGLLGIGIWLRVDKNASHFFQLTDTANTADGYAAVYFLIALGAFVFLLGFLGCAGACCESKCLLGLFAAIIVLIIMLEIVGAVMAGVYKSQIENGVMDAMKKQVTELYGSDDGITEAWDFIQDHLECCGAAEPEDWTDSDWAEGQPAGAVPASCCTEDASTCMTTNAYPEGCYDSLLHWVEHNLGIIIGVCCAIVFLELTAVIFAGCVMNAI